MMTQMVQGRHVTPSVREEVSNSSGAALWLVWGSFRLFTIQESAQAFQSFRVKSLYFFPRKLKLLPNRSPFCVPSFVKDPWKLNAASNTLSTESPELCKTEFLMEEGRLFSKLNLFRSVLDSYAKWRIFTFLPFYLLNPAVTWISDTL